MDVRIHGEHGGYALTERHPDGTVAATYHAADADAVSDWLHRMGVPDEEITGEDSGSAAARDGVTKLSWELASPKSYDMEIAGDPPGDESNDEGLRRFASHWTLQLISSAISTGRSIPVRDVLSGADGYLNSHHIVSVWPA